jgi:putative inorganic carbon (HCO3(-)) transporter
LFVGIAYQPFVYMLVALQIGLDTYMTRRSAEARQLPLARQVTGATKPKTLSQPRRPFTN